MNNLTKEIAMQMYQLIKEFGSADLAFKNQESSEFEPEHFVILDKELKRLRSELSVIKSGQLKISEREYDEEGQVVKEAEYLNPEDTDLYSLYLDSDYIDIETFINDNV